MWIDQRGSEVLPHNECLRLLAVAAQHRDIGHLGISTPSSPIIVPVNFVYHNAGVLCRIGPGMIADTAPGSLVAFEVDHVDRDSRQVWSVLLRGHARGYTSVELAQLSQQQLPVPLVHQPGDLLIFVRGDVITGRRFSVVDPGSLPDPG